MSVKQSMDKILVVDDLPSMRVMLRRMLYDFGDPEIDIAANGDEAIQKLRRGAYDVILCDYNLGDGKNGQQILEEARHMELLAPDCIFITITAESSAQNVLGTLEYQPDDYIIKPFSKELLHHRLIKLMKRKDDLIHLCKAIQKQQYASAISMAEDLVASKSSHMLEVLRMLGDLYIRTQDYESAVTVYQKVLNTRNLYWAKIGLGKAQYYLNNFELSCNIFTELLDENNRCLEAYDWLSLCHKALGSLDHAQEALASAINLSPRSVRRQRDFGKMALQNEDKETAERAYNSAVRHGEHSCFRASDEFVALSRIWTEKKKGKKALALLKSARKEFKNRPNDLLDVTVASVHAHNSQGQKGAAELMLNEAINLYQQHADHVSDDVGLELAKTTLQYGDEEKGKEILRNLVHNNHDNEEWLNKVNEVLEHSEGSGDLDEMVTGAVDEMMELNAKGIDLTEQGKLEEAIELFEEAAERVPSNTSFNLNAAQAMIMYMDEHGMDQSLLYKSRKYLDRVTRSGKSSTRHKELVRLLREVQKKQG